MTSDFERKPTPYGTGASAGTPAEITVGGEGGLGARPAATQSGFGNNTSINEASAGSGRGVGGSQLGADAERAKDAALREAGAAKAELRQAGSDIKDGVADLAATARAKAEESVEAGKSQLTSSLGDFAAAVRKASDELGERDQSMAAGLVREVANGLEQATGSIEGRSIQELTRSVAAFARRQPTTFLIGAALAGIALGRFARASGEHAGPGPDANRFADRHRDEDRGYTPGRSASSHPVSPPVSAGTVAPRPTYTREGVGSAATTGGSLSTGATTSSAGKGPAPAEGPSGAVLGHGSGSFDPQGGRDVR